MALSKKERIKKLVEMCASHDLDFRDRKEAADFIHDQYPADRHVRELADLLTKDMTLTRRAKDFILTMLFRVASPPAMRAIQTFSESPQQPRRLREDAKLHLIQAGWWRPPIKA